MCVSHGGLSPSPLPPGLISPVGGVARFSHQATGSPLSEDQPAAASLRLSAFYRGLSGVLPGIHYGPLLVTVLWQLC